MHSTIWIQNKKTGEKKLIAQKQLKIRNINLADEDCEWVTSTSPEEDAKAKIPSPPAGRQLYVMKNDEGRTIRVERKQIAKFQKRGFEITTEEPVDPETHVVVEETGAKDEEISDSELVDFLARLDAKDENLWDEDGMVKQEVLDAAFGGKIGHQEVLAAWPEFNKSVIE